MPRRGASVTSGLRPRGTVSIMCDDGEAERVDVPVAVARSLERAKRSGSPVVLSRAELLHLIYERTSACAAERIAGMVNRRDYTATEARERLGRDGYPAHVAQAAVEHAVEVGLIDESRFADVFIRSKLSAGWGRLRIERELGRRGIDVSDVMGWPDDYVSDESECERALAVARARRVGPVGGYERLVRHLTGRGYPIRLSMRVARQVMDEIEADAT